MQGDALEPQTIRAIQTLRSQGFSVRKCAEILNVSKPSVERHGKQVAAGPVVPIAKKDREGKLEKIIDLSSERLVEELENEKKIKIRTTQNGIFTQYMYLSLDEASDSLFTKQEIRIIDTWIRYATPKTAKQLSKESHDLTWELHEMGEEIDLYSTLLPGLQSIDPGVLKKSMEKFSEAAASEES